MHGRHRPRNAGRCGNTWLRWARFRAPGSAGCPDGPHRRRRRRNRRPRQPIPAANRVRFHRGRQRLGLQARCAARQSIGRPSGSARGSNSHRRRRIRPQFHNLTQADYRGFPTQNQGVLQSQFFIPRERWYFTGDLTKNVGFYTVINRGYGSLDILDAFICLRFDDRLGFASAA